VESLAFGQPGLHAVERCGQGAEVIVLHHRQALGVVAGRDAFGSLGQVSDRA
jgi:hypothetical protein